MRFRARARRAPALGFCASTCPATWGKKVRITRLLQCCSIGAVLLGAPGGALAQEATLTGTITDSTGGVLPGVTVTAVHETSGIVFESVTDGRGVFRVPVRMNAVLCLDDRTQLMASRINRA